MPVNEVITKAKSAKQERSFTESWSVPSSPAGESPAGEGASVDHAEDRRLYEAIKTVCGYRDNQAYFKESLNLLRSEIREERSLHSILSETDKASFERFKARITSLLSSHSLTIEKQAAEAEGIIRDLKRLVPANLRMENERDDFRSFVVDSQVHAVAKRARDLVSSIEVSKDFLKKYERMGAVHGTVMTYKGIGNLLSHQDGSSPAQSASSGYDLKQNFPDLPSGVYWIRPKMLEDPIQMYVDMESEGGGYDFALVSDATPLTAAKQTGPNGLNVVFPRSAEHWGAIKHFCEEVRGVKMLQAMRVCGGVYRDATTVKGGNYRAYPMNSQSGVPDWKVEDGGRWFLSEKPFGEPNGDYTHGVFLNLHSVHENGTPKHWNDVRSTNTGKMYVVSTNAKP